jgi:hypothetical protein
MNDYEPLDLSSCTNCGVEFAGDPAQPLVGTQSLHGLPFQIGACGDGRESCWIGFHGESGTTGPVTVPVGQKARTLIFAHALLESKVYEGENIGAVVAEYVVSFKGGESVRISVRERFEVSVWPTLWGQWPFHAMPDVRDGLISRYEGPFDASGRRQAEVEQGRGGLYYLTAWKNPHSSREIETITIEPAGRKFLVAGITLGHLEEDPLRKFPNREVQIHLTREEDAERPFGLEVEVDRGTVTFPHALPGENADSFVNRDFKGWGQESNLKSSPAYVEIGARPSAEVIVKNHGEEIVRANWDEIQKKGSVSNDRARIELVDRGRNWVHVKVVDDETDKPVPCRVHFRSPEGIPYQPHGHHNQVNRDLNSWHQDVGGDLKLGQVSYAYIDGTCQGWLPRGEIIADVARGFEYQPFTGRLHIEPGQRELTLRLKRWVHMNQRRWFSGDSHVHFLGTQGAHREAQGEDLNVVNLLQSQWGHLFTNSEDWIGKPTFSDDGNTIVYCSQENRQHILGHLTLLGLKEPVMPWCSDGPGEAELGGHMEITMSRWADACHAQGGTVIIPHIPNPNGEPATLIATGRADAVEFLIQDPYNHNEYYRYLNGGYRLPLVGGTDKMTSDVPVGLYRTYAYIPDDQPFTYDNWTRAVCEGRTFLSGGAMIDFTVNGARVGDTISLSGNGGTVEVEATAESIFPMNTLQIIQEGNVVASVEEAHGARKLHLKEKIQVTGHSWLAARCGGPGYFSTSHFDGWRRNMCAHTSPVYIAVGGDWWMFSQETSNYMLTLINGSLEHIRHMTAHHEPGTVTHHHHHHDHQEFLEEPFNQAAAAIHQRMHQLGIPH